jgi:predicted AlkP superfamily pyrophosphatase or phosphodiesterase
VVLSVDGMRHDYPDRVRGGAFERLEREGVRASRLIPPFPASTFPSHATLATGCYPERHGILNSRFVDARLGAFDRDGGDVQWLACEPLWVSAERSDTPAAVLNWVGSYKPWNGVEATVHRVEFESARDAEMLRATLEILRTPGSRPVRLVMVYLSGVDHAGHRHGPDSPEVTARVRSIDRLLGAFLRDVSRLPCAPRLNLMVVSDHGMTSRRGRLDVQGELSRHHVTARTLASGGTANVYLRRSSDRARAIDALRQLSGLRVYPGEALPRELHYRFPGRTGDLVLLAPLGVDLGGESAGSPDAGAGVHGFRGTEDEMGGIFFGWGPAFARGRRLSRIQAVDVYSIGCLVLGLRPARDTQGEVPEGLLTLRARGA